MFSDYFWTNHATYKMKYYGLSQSRIRRVIKTPLRIEEGIAPNTIAVMQPSSYKTKDGEKTWNQEIWVMYALKNQKAKIKNQSDKENFKNKKDGKENIRIISAWRYPGKTKSRGELPREILSEIAQALNVM